MFLRIVCAEFICLYKLKPKSLVSYIFIWLAMKCYTLYTDAFRYGELLFGGQFVWKVYVKISHFRFVQISYHKVSTLLGYLMVLV